MQRDTELNHKRRNSQAQVEDDSSAYTTDDRISAFRRAQEVCEVSDVDYTRQHWHLFHVIISVRSFAAAMLTLYFHI